MLLKQERPAIPEEQSVHARDGVADPLGCGNPLRSGIAGLSTVPDSQPPAIFLAPSHASNNTPSLHSDTTASTRKTRYARRAKRPRQGWRGRSAGMRESFAIGHSGSFDGARLTATSPSHQPPAFFQPSSHASNNTTPLHSDTISPTRKACYARRAKRPRQGWRGRSAWMRESFAIGHRGPFGGARLTATSPSHQPFS